MMGAESCFPGSPVGKAAQSLNWKCCEIHLGREVTVSLAKNRRGATEASASPTQHGALRTRMVNISVMICVD